MSGVQGGVPPLEALLVKPTAPQWVDLACQRFDELLLDHAAAEKKAAATAVSLLFLYGDDDCLAQQLARLAREELRHYEQVAALLRALDVAPRRRRAGRYAVGLRAAAARTEPARKLDLLLAAALIEARSCERFRLLAPVLPARVAHLYRRLARAEARHYEVYLRFAAAAAQRVPDLDWRARLAELASLESALATDPDPTFCFHSGTPAGSLIA